MKFASPATFAAAAGTALNAQSLLEEIAAIGYDYESGGYRRPVYSEAERQLVAWFVDKATSLGLTVETDKNGLVWAWWNPLDQPTDNSIVTGSHIDSVPGGGAYDGPLGVVTGLVAVQRLIAAEVRPARPLAVVVFPEEEGSRFGLPCLGSRLVTGAVAMAKAGGLTDSDGNTFAELSEEAGLDPSVMGYDAQALARMGAFVEVHVEQGRALADLECPVALATEIIGHGRWKLVFSGQGDHAGTATMKGRRDPMVAAAKTISEVQNIAHDFDGARGTVGRIRAIPGGTNVIPSQVHLWVDVRHSSDEIVARIVAEISDFGRAAALTEDCGFEIVEESMTSSVYFHDGLRQHINSLLHVPELPTGAGHDAGVLAACVPTAMLFVRNPEGISHAPQEYASPEDIEAGVQALTKVLESLLTVSDLGSLCAVK